MSLGKVGADRAGAELDGERQPADLLDQTARRPTIHRRPAELVRAPRQELERVCFAERPDLEPARAAQIDWCSRGDEEDMGARREPRRQRRRQPGMDGAGVVEHAQGPLAQSERVADSLAGVVSRRRPQRGGQRLEPLVELAEDPPAGERIGELAADHPRQPGLAGPGHAVERVQLRRPALLGGQRAGKRLPLHRAPDERAQVPRHDAPRPHPGRSVRQLRPKRRAISSTRMRSSTGRPCGQWARKSMASSEANKDATSGGDSASPARTDE